MEQQANYIRRIEIHGLWERFNIGWDLRPDVNILSGINGVGKTTILNRSVGYLEELSGEMKSDEKNGVRLFFDNPQATYIPYDVIRSYDRPLIMGDFTARMADKNVKSELDWQLYLLQRRYLDYQVNIGNKKKSDYLVVKLPFVQLQVTNYKLQLGESLSSLCPTVVDISLTSVTASSQPSIMTAGEWVVRIICTFGFSSRIIAISFCCHSI